MHIQPLYRLCSHPAPTNPPLFPLLFQILLVDQADRFVFKPLLYELLTNGTHPSVDQVADWTTRKKR